MPLSTTSCFPDINVWVALTYEGHVHHRIAAGWFETFAATGQLTAVTFDKGLRTKARSAVLLG